MIKVFKFGGASVKDACAVRNMTDILSANTNHRLIVVVSAMGKTTNALEKILRLAREGSPDTSQVFEQLTNYHKVIAGELFRGATNTASAALSRLWNELWDKLQLIHLPYDTHYDLTVSYGELISTTIISHYLHHIGIAHKHADARKLIITNGRFRAAEPDWDATSAKVREAFESAGDQLLLVQGFIGATPDRQPTTLGREGSDFTAAILGWCVDADEVVIWKDVPGLLNADPKRFPEARKLEKISYSEAIELAYYGATVIHPKTIKPLENKQIPLKVQSFVNPLDPPSLISADRTSDGAMPCFIVKENQILMSIRPRDFSLMNEWHLHQLFGTFHQLGININVMQTSARSLTVCLDTDLLKTGDLFRLLGPTYEIRYNEGLTLFTIRHYNEQLAVEFSHKGQVLLEQRSRATLQLVMRVNS
ncbi:MAG: aspartate kinase [Bacteroidetes bacterium]|nr:aspartate kinase [Bacteroidota bacterium]